MQDLGFSRGALATKPGYNFGFSANDEFSLRTAIEYATFGGNKDRIVMFRTAGVESRFINDNFRQVIFWGPAVQKPLVLLGADHKAEENLRAEPHDWAWTVQFPDGSTA